MAASRQPADEEASNRQALSPGLPAWHLLWTPQDPRAQLPACRGALLSQPPSLSPSLVRPRGSGGRGRRAQLTEHPPLCGTGRSAPAACARGRGRHRGREWRCPLRTVGRAGGGDDAAALVSCSLLQPTHVCPAWAWRPGRAVDPAGEDRGPFPSGPEPGQMLPQLPTEDAARRPRGGRVGHAATLRSPLLLAALTPTSSGFFFF